MEPCGCVKALIERNLRDIDDKIAALSRLWRDLRALTQSRTRSTSSNICPIIEGAQ
jgi:hypothetical protein